MLVGAPVAFALYEVLNLIGLSGIPVLMVSYVGGLVAGRVLGRDPRRAALGALVPLALVAPQTVAATELTQILILAVAALGLNILTGWAGQLNLAQGIFVGLGAYTTAILGTNHGWPLLLTLPVAGVLAAAVGALLGAIALRFAGVYLAVLTTSVALVVPIVLKHYSALTGGAQGIAVNPVELPAGVASTMTSEQFNYALALLVAMIAAHGKKTSTTEDAKLRDMCVRKIRSYREDVYLKRYTTVTEVAAAKDRWQVVTAFANGRSAR